MSDEEQKSSHGHHHHHHDHGHHLHQQQQYGTFGGGPTQQQPAMGFPQPVPPPGVTASAGHPPAQAAYYAHGYQAVPAPGDLAVEEPFSEPLLYEDQIASTFADQVMQLLLKEDLLDSHIFPAVEWVWDGFCSSLASSLLQFPGMLLLSFCYVLELITEKNLDMLLAQLRL